ncbi:MAG: hypothetical protein P1U56_18345 [Saprospiraceae bacterium]|nr:hypothetical protein [Saprospiraceae bacterium]
MTIKEIIRQVAQKLDSYSDEVQGNLKQIVTYFEDRTNLTDLEKKATEISFWRSIDDNSCTSMVGSVVDGSHEEIESIYSDFDIFANWDECISDGEIYEYIQEDEELSDELDAELEICYLQWFVRNWYAINGHLAHNLEYFLVENNSVRNFDLLRFNFTDLFTDHKGPEKARPYYQYKLSDYEIRQRVLMDMVDHVYHHPIKRTLVKGDSSIEFWYSKCALNIIDVSIENAPTIIVSKTKKEHENEYQIKSEYLKIMVHQIDELIDKGYKEVEY